MSPCRIGSQFFPQCRHVRLKSDSTRTVGSAPGSKKRRPSSTRPPAVRLPHAGLELELLEGTSDRKIVGGLEPLRPRAGEQRAPDGPREHAAGVEAAVAGLAVVLQPFAEQRGERAAQVLADLLGSTDVDKGGCPARDRHAAADSAALSLASSPAICCLNSVMARETSVVVGWSHVGHRYSGVSPNHAFTTSLMVR